MIIVGVVIDNGSYSPLYLFDKSYQLSDSNYAIARTSFHDFEVEVKLEDIGEIKLPIEQPKNQAVTLFTKNGIETIGLDDDLVTQYDISIGDADDYKERNVKKSAYDCLGE